MMKHENHKTIVEWGSVRFLLTKANSKATIELLDGAFPLWVYVPRDQEMTAVG